MPQDGGLGTHIVGDKIGLNHVNISVTKMIGEGRFSPVWYAGVGECLAGRASNKATRCTLLVCVSAGGFSYVYLVKEVQEGSGLTHSLHLTNKNDKKDDSDANGGQNSRKLGSGAIPPGEKQHMCLKVTSIHSRSQRDIAEKEAKLLSRLSHPSIIKMYDTCYRAVAHQSEPLLR